MEIKRCTKCLETKLITLFGKGKRYAGGIRSWCKSCSNEGQKKSYRRNPTRAREYAKIYFQENKERYLRKKREWVAKNKSKVRDYEKTKYERHKERILSYAAAYQRKNSSRHNEASRAWAIRNKHNRRYHSMLSKAAMRQAIAPWADMGAIKAIYEKARELEVSTGKKWHVDHIVPLRSKIVCGLHCEDNLQVLPAADNIRKGNRWWPDMP